MSAKYYYLWSPGSVLGAVQTLVQLLQIFAYMCLVGRALTVTSNLNYFKDIPYKRGCEKTSLNLECQDRGK